MQSGPKTYNTGSQTEHQADDGILPEPDVNFLTELTFYSNSLDDIEQNFCVFEFTEINKCFDCYFGVVNLSDRILNLSEL